MSKDYFIQEIQIMDYVNVTKDEINKCKDIIKDFLKDKKSFSLEEQLSKVEKNVYKLEYNNTNMIQKIAPLIKSISTFMAFQEASMELINENIIMPISQFYLLNYPRISICERIGENDTRSTDFTISNDRYQKLNIYIPIVPYGRFILRPSKKNSI